jgi:signal transduction histidine kinase
MNAASTRESADVLDAAVHDILTRVQGLIASAGSLAWQLPPEFRSKADNVVAKARSLATLLYTTVNYDRSYDFQQIRLEEVVQEAIQTYAEEAGRSNIMIGKPELSSRNNDRSRGDAPPMVPASRLHLQHAINNLVHNAIKYSVPSDKDRDCIEIEGFPDGQHYCIRISNYGIGIQPDELGEIFEDHVQGELAKPLHVGMGRGLYFVKKVVDQHKGWIVAESTQTSGGRYWRTRITVKLPFYR